MNNSELMVRMTAVQRLMAEQDIDYLFCSPSSDSVYLLDYPPKTSERLVCLVIPRTGVPSVVVPKLEVSRVEARSDIVEIYSWGETEDPVSILRDLVSDTENPTIAVSEQLWSIFLLRMMSHMPGAWFTGAASIISKLRMIKSDAELQELRAAAHAADLAWDEFVSTARLSGLTERQAATELARLREKHGLEVLSIGICASGPNSAAPHHITSDREIRSGDAVVFDFGGAWNHYRADVTRTVHVGEPEDEFVKVYDIVLKANAVAFRAFRPGVACQDIDRAAREIINDAGYGEYFIHRVGHGLGLDGHEEPYLVEGNTLPLEPGMVFSDEPGIYIPGRFGVRIEDSVVVTADGAEKINHCRRDLVIME